MSYYHCLKQCEEDGYNTIVSFQQTATDILLQAVPYLSVENGGFPKNHGMNVAAQAVFTYLEHCNNNTVKSQFAV